MIYYLDPAGVYHHVTGEPGRRRVICGRPNSNPGGYSGLAGFIYAIPGDPPPRDEWLCKRCAEKKGKP